LSSRGTTLSSLINDRKKIFLSSGEINFTLVDPKLSIRKVIASFEKRAISKDNIDGVSLNFGHWRFNLRCSNTEPLVRLNIESKGDILLISKVRKEIEDILKS
jgi:phosphomannomutase